MTPRTASAVSFFRRNALLTIDQVKFRKTGKTGDFVQAGLTLSPADECGTNFCPGSSPGCRSQCLITTYRLQTETARTARVRRSHLLIDDPGAFCMFFSRDLARARARARAAGLVLVIRPNATSDVDAPRLFGSLMADHPEDRWIDYTAVANRYARFLAGRFPANYHMTYSRKETNHRTARVFVRAGGTATVVVRSRATMARLLASGFDGLPCVAGDDHDRRWEDPRGHWVLLLAKGAAKGDTTGFVVD